MLDAGLDEVRGRYGPRAIRLEPLDPRADTALPGAPQAGASGLRAALREAPA